MWMNGTRRADCVKGAINNSSFVREWFNPISSFFPSSFLSFYSSCRDKSQVMSLSFRFFTPHFLLLFFDWFLVILGRKMLRQRDKEQKDLSFSFFILISRFCSFFAPFFNCRYKYFTCFCEEWTWEWYIVYKQS